MKIDGLLKGQGLPNVGLAFSPDGRTLVSNTTDATLREDYRRSLQPVVDDHRALYDAVAAGDCQRAAAVMHSHLLETARDMTLLLRNGNGTPA